MVEPGAWGYPSLASQQVTVSVEGLTGGNLNVAVGSASGAITPGSGRRSVTLTLGAGDTGNLAVTLTPVSYPTWWKRVKLELGGAATDWQARPVQAELQLCQRYFQRYANTSGSVSVLFLCYGYASNRVFGVMPLPVPMRASPTVTYANALVSTIATTIGTATSMSAYSTGSLQIITFDIFHDGTSAGSTAYTLILNGGTSNHLTLSAEL